MQDIRDFLILILRLEIRWIDQHSRKVLGMMGELAALQTSHFMTGWKFSAWKYLSLCPLSNG